MKSCEGNSTDSVLSYMSKETAPPRKNGELIFQEPWEARSFGMALALYENKNIKSWEDFRMRLIQEIADWEKENPGNKNNPNWNYYEQWLGALERLVVETGMLDQREVNTRADEFATGERDEAFF